MFKPEEVITESSFKYSVEEKMEFFNKAISQVDLHVFVYDVMCDKLYFFESATFPFGVLKSSEYSIQDIVNLDIMEKEVTPVFVSLFEAIKNGEKSEEAVIKICNGSTVTWNHVMIVNHFDEKGKPIRAVGTIQNVTHRIKIEQLYSKERQFRFAMLADSRRVYEINVTRDRFIKLESIQDTTDYGEWDVYTKTMAKLCKTRVHKDDWDAFLQVATKENLLQGFENNITEFHCEYRFVDDEGKASWSSSTTHLLKDPVSNDIKGFIYVKDIDKQKELEIKLYRQAETDHLTGIYNRRTAEKMITRILLDAQPTHIYGFLMFDIDEFKYVNDTFGHLKGDFLLQKIANDIKIILRDEDIFARMGGDEFVVFVKNVDLIKQISCIAKRLCKCVSRISIDEESDFHPTISIGISTYPANGNTFEELYKNSDIALYDVKQNGKNAMAFFSQK